MTTKKKPGRPPKASECHMMTLRLEPELVQALDRLVDQVHQEQRLKLSRVDLIRQAIWQFVDREMAEVR